MSAGRNDETQPAVSSTDVIRYSIVILTYARDTPLQLTLSNLKSMLGEHEDTEIVLVDNNSDDRDRSEFLHGFLHQQVIKTGRNKGVSGRNDGMDAARGDIIALLDDDVLVRTDDFLEEFRAVFDNHPDVGVVNVRKLDGKTMLQLPECIPHTDKHVDTSKPFFTFRFVGGLVGMRRSMHRELGGFSSEFFYGAEEREYSYRIIKAGWKIYYSPNVIAVETNDQGGRRNRTALMTDTLANTYIIAYLHKPILAFAIDLVLFTIFLCWKERGRVDLILAMSKFGAWKRSANRARRRPLDADALAYIRACGGATWR